jgi:hypothetical protein
LAGTQKDAEILDYSAQPNNEAKSDNIGNESTKIYDENVCSTISYLN